MGINGLQSQYCIWGLDLFIIQKRFRYNVRPEAWGDGAGWEGV